MEVAIITQNELKQILSYDHSTGIFTRIKDNKNQTIIGSIITYCDNKGYTSIKINGKQIRVHRLAWLYHYGYLPKLFIDHVDGIRTNNKITNLRLVTHQQNSFNRNIPDKRSKTGITGVIIVKGRYRALIQVNGKLIHLGYFTDIEEAKKIRRQAEISYFGVHAPN